MLLEINFVETPSAKSIFEGDLDAETLIANLTAFSGTALKPGGTLVFLDEVQECPKARTAIKFLVDDGRFDYIESGSLLGRAFRRGSLASVGYEQMLRMHPLSLTEFFLENGVQQETLDLVRRSARRAGRFRRSPMKGSCACFGSTSPWAACPRRAGVRGDE